MKFKSQVFTQVSGSVGGLTYAHNRGGLYTRARSIPTDPNSPPQQVVRAAFGLLVNRWLNTLTPFQRAAWDLYAFNVPLTGPLGDPITVSGQNMYVPSNTPRIRIGASIIDVAPARFNLGSVGANTIVNASEATQTVDLTFNVPDDWNIADGFLILQLSRPVNPTINFFRGSYRFAGSVVGPAIASPVTIPAPFGFVAGQRLFGRTIATDATARLSLPQFVGPLLTVA